MTSRAREFVQSFGPTWIVMIADVDAPSIFTAATAGALYGYGLAWFFLVLILPLFVVQEASGRIGVATGKGLGEVTRSSYSRKVACWLSLAAVLSFGFVAVITAYDLATELG